MKRKRLTKKHIKDVCKFSGKSFTHTAASCRYFDIDYRTGEPVCLKLKPDLKKTIDEEVDLSIKECDSTLLGLPMGDNCPGIKE